jgi:ribosomal protein S12 methylthiotransferase
MDKIAALISLGCAKNLVDSEVMAAQLAGMGYAMTADPAAAGLILVNTCGFLESAVQEAVDTILEAARHKETGSCRTLVAVGCMVQRYGKKLVELLPEVDLFVGTSHYHALDHIMNAHFGGLARKLWIGRPAHLFGGPAPRVLATPSHTAYLKIAEGCSNSCAFCMIPRLRGRFRSRSAEDILTEAAQLAVDGVTEINLVAQDTTAFGSDRNRPFALARLLESLDRLDGLAWVRLLYAYPERVTAELLQTMARAEKVVPYLDVPFQHCVPKILEAMGRKVSDPLKTVEAIRATVPGVALRTSLITGFPGETEADFESLARFVREAQFDHLGIFAFSPEPGTRAAKLPARPDASAAGERRTILLEMQREISRARLKRLRGRELPVLVEGHHPDTDLLLCGRLATQAPEVDGTVLIVKGEARPGEIVRARIVSTHNYDVEAEIVTTRPRGQRKDLRRPAPNEAIETL